MECFTNFHAMLAQETCYFFLFGSSFSARAALPMIFMPVFCKMMACIWAQGTPVVIEVWVVYVLYPGAFCFQCLSSICRHRKCTSLQTRTSLTYVLKAGAGCPVARGITSSVLVVCGVAVPVENPKQGPLVALF